MSKRDWFVALAVGLLLLSSSAGAQQQHQGTPGEGPSVTPGHSEQTDSGKGPASLPVVIVQTPEQAADAEKGERDSAAHDAADLEQQRRAADAAERGAASAERQEIPAFVQIWIASIGTVIAVSALALTIVSNRRSDRSNQEQTRAYVILTADHVNSFGPNTICTVSARADNKGATPAKNVRRSLFVCLMTDGVWPDTETLGEALSLDPALQGNSLGIGAYVVFSKSFDIPFSTKEISSIRSGKTQIVMFVHVEYDDVFGRNHVEDMAFSPSGDDTTMNRLTSNYPKRDLFITFILVDGYGRST